MNLIAFKTFVGVRSNPEARGQEMNEQRQRRKEGMNCAFVKRMLCDTQYTKIGVNVTNPQNQATATDLIQKEESLTTISIQDLLGQWGSC